jgi:hypothetical protein
MKNIQPQPDPIKAYQRTSTAARRVGNNNRCRCGETRIEALVGRSGICAECLRTKRGHTLMDNHHVAGKSNSHVTVAIPANDHRSVLSVAQYDWPKETLEILKVALCELLPDAFEDSPKRFVTSSTGCCDGSPKCWSC